jgi:O-antigen chain-terminating methyltransferase
MTSGVGAEGSAAKALAAEPGLEEQVRALVQAVADVGRLARDAQCRVGVLEADLRELREAQERPATPAGGGGPAGWGPRFAAIYDDFTDRFRGPPADVRAKLEGYLPDVRRLVGSGGVLDLGSGRGEWLTLLRDAGVPARGVDTNPAFVAASRARGLDVELSDALGHLRGVSPDSLDMVTAFHVIEHLGTEELLELLEGAWRVLRPGGCVLLETPNPTNLVMAACDFYNDPTHRSPLPPALTEFLVSAQAFGDVEVRPLHPKPYRPATAVGDDASSDLRDLVWQMFFGPQDYAVLGYKPPVPVR